MIYPYLHLKILEETPDLTLHEKLNLLQLQLKTRMSVEVGYRYKSVLNIETGLYEKKSEDLAEIEKSLKQLPYPYRKISFVMQSRNQGYYDQYHLFMVSRNDYIDKYIGNYWQTFTDYEIGVIYGYPATCIQAFVKMLERYPALDEEQRTEYTPAMEYIGCGWYSKDFFEQEKEHYNKIWEQIRSISPTLVRQAEEELRKERGF